MFNGQNPCFISTEGRWLPQRIQDAPTALERAAPCHARPRGQVQARMDDRACRWHRTLPIGRSGDFGTSPLFLQLKQVADLPVLPKWGRKCKAQWQCTYSTDRCGTLQDYVARRAPTPSIRVSGSMDGLIWQAFPPERRAMFCYVDELERPMCNGIVSWDWRPTGGSSFVRAYGCAVRTRNAGSLVGLNKTAAIWVLAQSCKQGTRRKLVGTVCL